jgi:hypothetical protein
MNEVTGTVYSEETDKIIPYATVTATCGGSTTKTTADKNGYFDFNVPDEECTISGGTLTYIVGLTITPGSGGDVIETGDGIY